MRTLLCTAIAFVLWYYSSKAVHDVLVWGAVVLALPRVRRAWPVWRNAAGMAFIAVLLLTLCTVPWSVQPADSMRDLLRWIRLPAGAFAISVWFNRPAALRSALGYSALAITLVLAADLVRLVWVLRGGVWVHAHAYEPFMLNHSNVSSLLAAGCGLVFVTIAATAASRWRRIVAVTGLVIGLIYLVVLASRGPQLAFVLTVAVAGLVWIPSRRGRMAWVVAGLLAIGLLGLINPRFRNRAEVADFAGRTTVWKHTWALTQHRPWQGYGFGKRGFQAVYQASDPPASPFTYPHPHSYPLFVLFQHGWPGLIIYGLAWTLLAARLAGTLWRLRRSPERWWPALVALLLLLWHIYGLGDYPDNRLAIMLVWLIPAALIVTHKRVTTTSVCG